MKELHVTILYDEERGIPWQCQEYSPPLELDPRTYKIEALGKALVLRFENQQITARHDQGLREYGIEWNFPSFKSHVTLSYGSGQSPRGIQPPTFPLYLSHEFSVPFDSGSCD